ncbi:hypothetical protein U1Q18_014125, partial [Sarracenia purpurea var. burkii]
YERLPVFYYRCGIIGHHDKECSEVDYRHGIEVEKEYQYGPWLRAMANQKFPKGKQSGNKAESASTEHGSTEGSPRQGSRKAGGMNLTSATGNSSDSKSRSNLERIGQTNPQKETKSNSTINIPKEYVSAEKVLTSSNTNLSRDGIEFGRIPDLGGKGADGGGNRKDEGDKMFSKDIGSSNCGEHKKPKVGLGLVEESPHNFFTCAITQNPDPVGENTTQSLLKPVHDSEDNLSIRVQSWKRRARVARRNSSPATSNGEKKKRKAANEGEKGINVEGEEDCVRKTCRTGMHQGGKHFNLDTVEAETQPHRMP